MGGHLPSHSACAANARLLPSPPPVGGFPALKWLELTPFEIASHPFLTLSARPSRTFTSRHSARAHPTPRGPRGAPPSASAARCSSARTRRSTCGRKASLSLSCCGGCFRNQKQLRHRGGGTVSQGRGGMERRVEGICVGRGPILLWVRVDGVVCRGRFGGWRESGQQAAPHANAQEHTELLSPSLPQERTHARSTHTGTSLAHTDSFFSLLPLSSPQLSTGGGAP